MHIFFDFITGMSVGVEFFLGDALEPEDKFAMTLDIVIVRLTLVIRK